MSSSSLRQWGIYSLTAQTSDTSPSLLLCFDSARYLFNAGEGTTRAFLGRSAGFKKLGTLFATRADSQTAGGLPGLVLTLSEHHGDQSIVTDLDIIGPPNLSHLMAASRFHTRRNMIDVRLHETVPHDVASVPKEPIYSDACVQVFDFAMRQASTATRGVKRKRETSPPHTNGSEVHRASQMKGAQAKDWLRGVIGDMFHGLEYRYSGPRPSPAWDPQPLPQPLATDSDVATSYLIIGPQQRGKFQPEKAKAQGVPSGPLFGKLHRGERVQLPDGRWIEPDSCVSEDGPRNAFLVIDCQSKECIEQVTRAAFAATADANKATLKVAFHLLGPGVLHEEPYWTWAAALGDIEHVISAPEVVPDQIAFGSASLLQMRLAKLDPCSFPTPHFCLHPELPLSKAPYLPSRATAWTPDRRWSLGTGDFAFPPYTRQHDFELGSEEADKRLAQLHVPNTSPHDEGLTKAGLAAWADFLQSSDTAKAKIDADLHKRRTDSRQKAVDDVVITTLGTGSATPSVYRNVSATLVEIPARGTMLLDCGDNTIGQLRRYCGGNETDEILRSLRLICISHMHSDHHSGLAALLHTRSKLPDAPSMSLIAPRLIWLGLQDHDAVEPLGLENVTFLHAPSIMGQMLKASPAALEPLSLSSIRAIEVDHRGGQCFGYVIDSTQGWRLVYSGDTRPTDKLVAAGKDADILIHEATLDDEHAPQAKIKGHSTTGQALDVAKRMNAKTVVLTHFSQRYPKLTTLSPELLDGSGTDAPAPDVVLAFDGMRMPVKDAWKGRHFLLPMQTLLRELEIPTQAQKNDPVGSMH